MTNKPIPADAQIPDGTEIYALKEALRLDNGDWIAAVYLVDRGDKLKLREGIWILRRPAATLDNPAPEFAPCAEAVKLSGPMPITKLHGELAKAKGGAVHFVAHDKRRLYFIPVAGPGSLS